MPIQWLCWDQVTMDSEGNAQTSCHDANQTCVAGSCVDKNVDPASLDDFTPERVFGGGTGKGGDGTCFDTAGCFDATTVDAPTSIVDGDCVITARPDQNVAIRVDTAGICGAAGCLVPLDAKSELGWQVGSNGTLKLPHAVCERIMTEHTASGVSIVTSTSTCPLKTNDIPTCGPWSSAGKAPPDPADLGPVTVSANQETPIALQVVGKRIVWANAGTGAVAGGQLKSIAITGGSTFPLTTTPQAFPADVKVDLAAPGGTTAVYWSNRGITVMGVSMGASVLGLNITNPLKPAALTVPVASALQGPSGLSLSKNTLLFADFGGKSIYRVDAGAAVKIASNQTNPFGTAADSASVFWTNEGDPMNPGSVEMSNVVDPSGVIELAKMQSHPRNIAVDADANGVARAVYWVNYAPGGAVMRVQFNAGMPDPAEVFAANQGTPYGLAISSDTVYWTNRSDQTVMKKALSAAPGDAPIVVAKNQNEPGAVTFDATQIYWVNLGKSGSKNGSVMRISKAAPPPK